MSRLTLFPITLSDTDFTLYSQCHYRWFRERCQHLKKATFDINLTAGKAFAIGIETTRKLYYIDGVNQEEAILRGSDKTRVLLHNAEYQDELKSPARMSLAVREYFKVYPMDIDEIQPMTLPDGTKGIEHTFELELPIAHPETGNPLVYKGVLDLLGSNMGRPCVIDEKTCKSLSKPEMFAAAGQQIGYASASRKLGIPINDIYIRQVAIQKNGNKHQQIPIAVTDFMVDRWEQSMLTKVRAMVAAYTWYTQGVEQAHEAFLPDYKMGCTSFFKPCPYVEGCVSEYGEGYIDGEFEQMVSVTQLDGERILVPIAERREELGL